MAPQVVGWGPLGSVCLSRFKADSIWRQA